MFQSWKISIYNGEIRQNAACSMLIKMESNPNIYKAFHDNPKTYIKHEKKSLASKYGLMDQINAICLL